MPKVQKNLELVSFIWAGVQFVHQSRAKEHFLSFEIPFLSVM